MNKFHSITGDMNGNRAIHEVVKALRPPSSEERTGLISDQRLLMPISSESRINAETISARKSSTLCFIKFQSMCIHPIRKSWKIRKDTFLTSIEQIMLIRFQIRIKENFQSIRFSPHAVNCLLKDFRIKSVHRLFRITPQFATKEELFTRSDLKSSNSRRASGFSRKFPK